MNPPQLALLLALLLTGALHTMPAQAAARVVTLAPHLAELVCAVGACAQIVGVGRYTDFPPELADRPLIGDAFAVNYEQVLALRPDLVLVWEGGTPPATIERLRQLGLPVEAIRVRRLDDIGLALLRVGALLGAEDAACAAEAAFRDGLAELRARYRDAEPLPVLYQLQAEPIYTVNAQSPISEALAVCGGINVFADLTQLAAAVSREAVLAADPAVILFGQQDDVAAIRASWASFSRLRAVRRDNLLSVNADLLARATPRMVEGVAELCATLDAARRRLAR